MESLEGNKAFAAVLTAGIVFMGATLIADVAVRSTTPKTTAIKIAAAEGAAAGASGPVADPPVALELASASVAKGEALTKQEGCVACHTFNEGGKAGIGPNLYGVVGGPHGHMPGYDYSEALKSKKGPWTYAELYEWLKKPSAYAPGTKMTFAGLADPQKRADVIDYLHSLSPNPEPLPPPPPKEASATAPAAAAGVQPIAERLAAANPETGEADTMKLGCIACHTFNLGGHAGVGPNLYGVVGAPHGHMAGFAYSSALKEHKGPWTFAELDEWLTKPSAYAPGTKMTFVGIPNPQERADVIDYLRTLSPSPEPLPPTGSKPAAPPAGITPGADNPSPPVETPAKTPEAQPAK